MNKMRKQILAILLLPILVSLGCGSGSGGNGGSQFVLTAKGFPDVSGKYSLNMGVLKNNCGAEEDPAEFMGNYIVTQVDDHINMKSADSDSIIERLEASGWTIVDKSDHVGIIGKDAQFTASSGATMEHNALGTFYINWATSGNFTPTGLSAAYGFTVFNNLDSCTYETNITGVKI